MKVIKHNFTLPNTSEPVIETHIEGLWYLPQTRFEDDRGFYAELARMPEIEAVLDESFETKQVNLSHSKTNVIRGFHAEDWNKLALVTTGRAFCALVDLREESDTFLHVEQFVLGEGEDALPGSLFISRGIANSFCVIDGPVNYFYAVDALYKDRDLKGDKALSLFDEDLDIEWPIPKEELIYSVRDADAIRLQEMFPEA